MKAMKQFGKYVRVAVDPAPTMHEDRPYIWVEIKSREKKPHWFSTSKEFLTHLTRREPGNARYVQLHGDGGSAEGDGRGNRTRQFLIRVAIGFSGSGHCSRWRWCVFAGIRHQIHKEQRLNLSERVQPLLAYIPTGGATYGVRQVWRVRTKEKER